MNIAEIANTACAQENVRGLSADSLMYGWGAFFIYYVPSSLLKKNFAELAVFICAGQIILVLCIINKRFAILEPN